MNVWILAARPRTLPAAIAPVIVGAAVGSTLVTFRWREVAIALLCMLVAISLQVGVNYANDYSDGIRGTDSQRVGPVRIVAQGLAPPAAVKKAAFLSFAIAAVIGVLLVIISQLWWLLLIGAVAIVAAWFYTGGSRPYGYSGWGEVSVFLFFGVVAVTGTTAAITSQVSLLALASSIPMGMLASALLLVNNIRDIPSDLDAHKLTLATRLGQTGARRLYVALVWGPYLWVTGMAIVGIWTSWPAWILLVWLSLPLSLAPVREVHGGAHGHRLVAALGATARVEIVFSVLLAVGLLTGALS